MKYDQCEYELSRPLKIDTIPRGGIEEKIVASPKERSELIKRFHLLESSRFEAFLNVDNGRDHMLEVKGRLWADVVMTCVVTLEPVPLTITEDIDVLYAPPHMIASADNMAELGDLDQPEPILNGHIDLGELAVQHLATALPLYPRKEGAFFEDKQCGETQKAENNPFVNLKDYMEK